MRKAPGARGRPDARPPGPRALPNGDSRESAPRLDRSPCGFFRSFVPGSANHRHDGRATRSGPGGSLKSPVGVADDEGRRRSPGPSVGPRRAEVAVPAAPRSKREAAWKKPTEKGEAERKAVRHPAPHPRHEGGKPARGITGRTTTRSIATEARGRVPRAPRSRFRSTPSRRAADRFQKNVRGVRPPARAGRQDESDEDSKNATKTLTGGIRNAAHQ